MDFFERLLEEIQPYAKSNGMVAFIVGKRSYPDDRLLKICPSKIRSKVFLEIGADWLIQKLPSDSDTAKFRGTKANKEWIVQFIHHFKQKAKRLNEEQEAYEASLNQSVKVVLDKKGIESRANERRTVDCSCGGWVEGCKRCYGKGHYTVDGFGRILK